MPFMYYSYLKKTIFIIIGIIVFLFLAVNVIKSRQPSEPQNYTEEEVLTINSLGTEDQPFISPDGNTLCFLYSPMDFEQFLKLAGKPLATLPKVIEKVDIIGPFREGFSKDDFYNKQILFRGYCSEKIGKKWTKPKLAPHELIPRDSGTFAKFLTINSADTLIIESSNHIKVKNGVLKGNGDFTTFTKLPDGTLDGPYILSEYFNTPYMEQDLHITDDEKTLIFRSDRPEALGDNDYGDIFISHFINGEWSEPENIGAPINTAEAFEAPGWLSPDKKRIYFTRAYPQPKNTEKTGIYFSEKINEIWKEPEKLDLGVEFKNIFAPSLVNNEEIIYYEIIPKESNNFQIYYSVKQPDGSWSKGMPVD